METRQKKEISRVLKRIKKNSIQNFLSSEIILQKGRKNQDILRQTEIIIITSRHGLQGQNISL
jgi:hypothetical protein